MSWIQPPTVRGSAKVPEIGFDAILAAVQAVPEPVSGQWDDIDRLDLQPGKGMVKVQGKNRWGGSGRHRDGRGPAGGLSPVRSDRVPA